MIWAILNIGFSLGLWLKPYENRPWRRDWFDNAEALFICAGWIVTLGLAVSEAL